MDTTDLLRELKHLRTGRGLTTARLKRSPAILAALDTTDAEDAYRIIEQAIQAMGDGEGVRALRVDFGLDLADLFRREPIPRECDYLGQRRDGYSGIILRDTKTLGRWSDKAIAELASRLQADPFDGYVLVTAGVQNRRLAGIEVLRYERGDTSRQNGRTTGYTNPADGPSLPALFYGLPADWKASSIEFIVTFLDQQPAQAWALAADNLFELSVGHQRYAVDIEDRMICCRIENPNNDEVYGIWWSW